MKPYPDAEFYDFLWIGRSKAQKAREFKFAWSPTYTLDKLK
jgi:hypothetical protein